MVEMGGGVEGFPSQAGLVAFCREELVVKSLLAAELITIWTQESAVPVAPGLRALSVLGGGGGKCRKRWIGAQVQSETPDSKAKGEEIKGCWVFCRETFLFISNPKVRKEDRIPQPSAPSLPCFEPYSTSRYPPGFPVAKCRLKWPAYLSSGQR